MPITAKMKKWLIENCNVKATATDEEFTKAAIDALADGSLTGDKYKELSTTKEDEKASEVGTMFKEMSETITGLKSVLEGLVTGQKTPEKKEGESAEEKGGEPTETKTPAPHTMSALEKAVTSIGGFGMSDDSEKSFDIRVKEAADMYGTTKTTRIYPTHTEKGTPHPLAGQQVRDYTTGGHAIDAPSQRDEAVIGAWSKFMVATYQFKSRTLAWMKMPQHDKELILHAMQNYKWGGSSDGKDFSDINDRNLTPFEQKALIDDATSGGLEAAPIVFDDRVIETPLLYGELFPLVNVTDLDRGRRIEGVATGTVTGGWGGVDGTDIDLFDTTSYVSAFDTTIFRWEGAVQVGLDFLSDTPINFGQHFTRQYGERLLEDLDDVIAVGNGTTQPEGAFNVTGAASVSFGGVAATLGGYESLRFGVAKQEHRSNLMNTVVFVGTETSYQRARAIPVGSGDARRLGGMDYSSYQWMERPYKINESLTNAQIFYAVMGRYRMYRRRGLTIRTSTEGQTLIRKNMMLIVATARYGGQMERGGVVAKTSTAEA